MRLQRRLHSLTMPFSGRALGPKSLSAAIVQAKLAICISSLQREGPTPLQQCVAHTLVETLSKSALPWKSREVNWNSTSG
jgi:hypothetical protein